MAQERTPDDGARTYRMTLTPCARPRNRHNLRVSSPVSHISSQWRATRYVGCAEASTTYEKDGKSRTCRAQVCRYAKPGNCGMSKYKDAKGVVDWKTPMLMDDTRCTPDCPPEGCYDE